MAKKLDDYTLDEEKQRLIRQHAEKALRAADALGSIPTPVDLILATARIEVSDDPVLDEDFLANLRIRAGRALRRALSKVLGILDAAARIIYLDKSLLAVKRTFLKLHETAHALLPWQRNLFVVAEECELTIAPEVADLFEREANAFASDVLFQMNSFSSEANDHEFNILVPVRLAKRYNASIYSSVRRYVTGSTKACMVLVLEPPQLCSRRGYVAKLRRDVMSPEFAQRIGPLDWPDEFDPDDQIGAMIPVDGRKMSRPREIVLQDCHGIRHRCLAEAFTQTHHVFVLIHSIKTLSRRIVTVS